MNPLELLRRLEMFEDCVTEEQMVILVHEEIVSLRGKVEAYEKILKDYLTPVKDFDAKKENEQS